MECDHRRGQISVDRDRLGVRSPWIDGVVKQDHRGSRALRGQNSGDRDRYRVIAPWIQYVLGLEHRRSRVCGSTISFWDKRAWQ